MQIVQTLRIPSDRCTSARTVQAHAKTVLLLPAVSAVSKVIFYSALPALSTVLSNLTRCSFQTSVLRCAESAHFHVFRVLATPHSQLRIACPALWDTFIEGHAH